MKWSPMHCRCPKVQCSSWTAATSEIGSLPPLWQAWQSMHIWDCPEYILPILFGTWPVTRPNRSFTRPLIILEYNKCKYNIIYCKQIVILFSLPYRNGECKKSWHASLQKRDTRCRNLTFFVLFFYIYFYYILLL